MKASWNGRHVAASSPMAATSLCAAAIDVVGSDARTAATCEAMR